MNLIRITNSYDTNSTVHTQSFITVVSYVSSPNQSGVPFLNLIYRERGQKIKDDVGEKHGIIKKHMHLSKGEFGVDCNLILRLTVYSEQTVVLY
uniref:Uncharacterized protein n=1 Tax=Arundo donax TaxID=35708 RepID=A0A0A9FL45_ARUDO